MKKLLNSDWFWLILAGIIGLICLFMYEPTTTAQSIRKINKTTVIVEQDPQHVKQDTILTKYKVIVDSTIYPVYMNSKSGSMFIVRISQKTGKYYRCYVIKGKKIKDLFK